MQVLPQIIAHGGIRLRIAANLLMPPIELSQEDIQAIEYAIPKVSDQSRLCSNTLSSNPSQSRASPIATTSTGRYSTLPQSTHASQNAVQSKYLLCTATQSGHASRPLHTAAGPRVWRPDTPPVQDILQKVHATNTSSSSTIPRPASTAPSKIPATQIADPNLRTASLRRASLAALGSPNEGSTNDPSTDVSARASAEPTAEGVHLGDVQKKASVPIEAFDSWQRLARPEDIALIERHRKTAEAMAPPAIPQLSRSSAQHQPAAVTGTQSGSTIHTHSVSRELNAVASANPKSTEIGPTVVGSPNVPRLPVENQASGTTAGSSTPLSRPTTQPIAQMSPLTKSSTVMSTKAHTTAFPSPMPVKATMSLPSMSPLSNQPGAMPSLSQKRTHSTMSSPHPTNSASISHGNPSSPPKRPRTQSQTQRLTDAVKSSGTWPSSENIGLDYMRMMSTEQRQSQDELEIHMLSSSPAIVHPHGYHSSTQQWINKSSLDAAAQSNTLLANENPHPYPLASSWPVAASAAEAAGYFVGQPFMAMACMHGTAPQQRQQTQNQHNAPSRAKSQGAQQRFASASANFYSPEEVLHGRAEGSKGRDYGASVVLNGIGNPTFKYMMGNHQEQGYVKEVEEVEDDIEPAPRDGAQIEGVEMRGKRVVGK